MKTNIAFYEVIDNKNRWAGNYSAKFDGEINVGCSGFQMARINARDYGGKVLAVSQDGLREVVWPKI